MIQLWQHNRSGEYLLVKLTQSGDVISAMGPIAHRDLAQSITQFDGGDITPESVTPGYYHLIEPRDLRNRGASHAADALAQRVQ